MHHLATILLVTFSYVNNMVRVGSLVMCLHDAADVLMEVSPPVCLYLSEAAGSAWNFTGRPLPGPRSASISIIHYYFSCCYYYHYYYTQCVNIVMLPVMRFLYF